MLQNLLIHFCFIVFQKSLSVSKTKSSSPLIRTVSSPSIIKKEITVDRTRTVSLDGIDIDEDEVFSQWNDELSNSSSVSTTNIQTSSTITDSKSIWKQIFSKPVKSKSTDDELKGQWSELDKDQSSNHYRFNGATAGVKRTCPFYKKIPGKLNSLVYVRSIRLYRIETDRFEYIFSHRIKPKSEKQLYDLCKFHSNIFRYNICC